jgi:phospholipase C
MKLILKTVALFTIFGAGLASASQNLNGKVKHIIVVIQENRTPDNLFQQDQTLISNGAHIAYQGSCGHGLFDLNAAPLGTCWDTDHSHTKPYPSWTQMWAHGAMTGACQIHVYSPNCIPPPPACPDTNYATCPAMTYVQNTEWDPVNHYHILDPYFQLANQYGWANYMFQTNQGPSFPAHQFLISGTSAPISYNDPQSYYQWFDAENVTFPREDPNKNTGCIAYGNTQTQKFAYAWQIAPDFSEGLGYTPPPPVNSQGFPCYDHPTLTDLLEANHISWRYYARKPGDLWTAPTAIRHICGTPAYDGACTGNDWLNNVGAGLPTQTDAAPFLTDIQSCNLQNVSWVIPDGNWSDHNDNLPGDGGPSWLAAIANAIGQDKSCENGNGYWSDTVILITWDDWGGFYDDVDPESTAGGPGIGYSNNTGQQYVYGFRVPLLVVSAYAKQSYISGPASNPLCHNNNYCHDFGSILNFIEYAFGQNGNSLGTIGDPHWPYADALAPDAPPTCPPSACPYSLSDFFVDFSHLPPQSPFQAITGAKYRVDCFHHPLDPGCFQKYPLDPDDDAAETD